MKYIDLSVCKSNLIINLNNNFISFTILFLVTCIWGYMGCAKHGKKDDKDCKEDFNGCSMIAMGMAPATTTTER